MTKISLRTTAKDRAKWRRWLERHDVAEPVVWLVTARKRTGQGCESCAEAVDEALCLGASPRPT